MTQGTSSCDRSLTVDEQRYGPNVLCELPLGHQGAHVWQGLATSMKQDPRNDKGVMPRPHELVVACRVEWVDER